MEFFPSPGASAQFSKTTLVLPAVAIGNVGQLAIDLLVASLDLTRIGFLEESNVLPCIGNDPFDTAKSRGSITVALEVFQDAKRGITVVQQRAPVIQGRMEEFARSLGKWVADNGFEEVILLSGFDSGRRVASQMHGHQIRYFSSASDDFTDKRCEAIGWVPLEGLREEVNGASGEQERGGADEGMEDGEAEAGPGPAGPLRGGQWGPSDGGYFPSLSIWKLFRSCKANGVKALALTLFCAEGDNVPDAISMANYLDSLLNLLPSGPSDDFLRWKIPVSWSSVYGPPPDDVIY